MKIKNLDRHVLFQFSGMQHVSYPNERRGLFYSTIPAVYASHESLKKHHQKTNAIIGVISTGVDIKENNDKVFKYEINCLCDNEDTKNQIVEHIILKFNPNLRTNLADITLGGIVYGRTERFVTISFSIQVEPLHAMLEQN